jgi:hypothetical protein
MAIIQRDQSEPQAVLRISPQAAQDLQMDVSSAYQNNVPLLMRTLRHSSNPPFGIERHMHFAGTGLAGKSSSPKSLQYPSVFW